MLASELAKLDTQEKCHAAIDKRLQLISECVGQLYPGVLQCEIEAIMAHQASLAEAAIRDRDKRDAERYRYIRDVLTRIGSPKMDGQHFWHLGTLKAGRGPTLDAAIDMEMRERPRLSQAELLVLIDSTKAD